MPVDWQIGMVVPIFKKGDRRVHSNYQGITLLSLPEKAYARVLERKLWPIVEPQIQEEQCGFHPGHGRVHQLFTLARILEGSWELAHPVYMCFVDLEKAYDCVPWGTLWGYCGSMGYRDCCHQPFGPHITRVRAVSAFSAGNQTRSEWVLFMIFHGQDV